MTYAQRQKMKAQAEESKLDERVCVLSENKKGTTYQFNLTKSLVLI